MNIIDYEVEAHDYANLDKDWRYGKTHSPVQSIVNVALRADDGTIGEGCLPVLGHFGKSTERFLAEIMGLAAQTRGWSAQDWQQNAQVLRDFKAGPAVSAVDMAMLDLAAKCARQPVWKYLGGQGDARVPIVRIIPLKSAKAMADVAQNLVGEGYKALKLKASGDLALDVARVEAVAERVGREIEIYVDANQAYDAQGAIAFAQKVRTKITRLEQPVAAMDLKAMAQVTSAAGVFLEADEHIKDCADVERIAEARAAHGISLKFGRSSGVLETLEMARVAQTKGLKYRMGTAFGGTLISLAGAHVAAALDQHDGYAEVGEFMHFDDPLHLPAQVQNGDLILSETPGFGQVRRKDAPIFAD